MDSSGVKKLSPVLVVARCIPLILGMLTIAAWISIFLVENAYLRKLQPPVLDVSMREVLLSMSSLLILILLAIL
jgi:hypothetical protein